MSIIILIHNLFGQDNLINVLFTQDSELCLNDIFIILEFCDYINSGYFPLLVGIFNIVILISGFQVFGEDFRYTMFLSILWDGRTLWFQWLYFGGWLWGSLLLSPMFLFCYLNRLFHQLHIMLYQVSHKWPFNHTNSSLQTNFLKIISNLWTADFHLLHQDVQ